MRKLSFSKYQEQSYSFDEVYRMIWESSQPTADFYVMMTFSVVIAAVGLLLNSGAIIIGAMIMAPLMDPILGISFSTLTGDISFRIRAVLTVVYGALLGIIVSYLIGHVFALVGATQEIMARTAPSILDLIVALAAGFVGGYAKVRKPVAATVSGVAIAISLVPPLSVVGIGLAFHNPQIYLGAGLLFITNVVSIIFSGTVAFMLLESVYFRQSVKSLVVPVVSVLIIAIPLSFSFVSLVEKRYIRNQVARILKENTHTFKDLEIISLEVDTFRPVFEITVTVRAAMEDITDVQVQQVQEFIEKILQRPVHLTVNLSPLLQRQGQLKE